MSAARGLSGVERVVIVVVGSVGYRALGVVSLLVVTPSSRWRSNTTIRRPVDGTRRSGCSPVWERAAGRWPLGPVSAGLILYGFSFVLLVRYRSLYLSDVACAGHGLSIQMATTMFRAVGPLAQVVRAADS